MKSGESITALFLPLYNIYSCLHAKPFHIHLFKLQGRRIERFVKIGIQVAGKQPLVFKDQHHGFHVVVKLHITGLEKELSYSYDLIIHEGR